MTNQPEYKQIVNLNWDSLSMSRPKTFKAVGMWCNDVTKALNLKVKYRDSKEDGSGEFRTLPSK